MRNWAKETGTRNAVPHVKNNVLPLQKREKNVEKVICITMDFCIAMDLQPVVFATHLIQFCNENNDSDLTQVKNFCHYLKHKLKGLFINYREDNIQQSVTGKVKNI